MLGLPVSCWLQKSGFILLRKSSAIGGFSEKKKLIYAPVQIDRRRTPFPSRKKVDFKTLSHYLKHTVLHHHAFCIVIKRNRCK